MVLELLLNPKKAERKPWELFFLGLIYASFAFLLSIWMFKDQVSIIMVALTAICAVPLVYNIIKLEAEKDSTLKKENWLIKEHGKAVSAFTFLFLGFVAAFLVLFLILPNSTSQEAFKVQIDTISQITTTQTPTGNLVSTFGTFTSLILNNVKVLVFCFILSFFFGAGAIFILTWNASVVAVAIGTFVKNNILSYLDPSIASYSQLVYLGLVKYMTHGIFEIVAYFIGALAGGIFSIAVIGHDFRTKEFRKILFDSIDIMAISMLFLIVAALVEVFVTPFIV